MSEQAAQIAVDADPGRVAAYYTRLQAAENPAELAAAVAFALDPMLTQARDDREQLRIRLQEADDRVLALERLAVAAEAVVLGVGPDDATVGTVVAGSSIAEAAVAVARHEGRHELAYREWFALFRRHGYVIESSDPLAVFLTALTRSPLVERVGERSGIYRIVDEREEPV